MSDQPHPDVHALRVDVRRLERRVEELEHAMTLLGTPPRRESDPWAEVARWDEPAPAAPIAPPAALTPPPRPPAPPRPPFDWGRFAEHLFAARTLAGRAASPPRSGSCCSS